MELKYKGFVARIFFSPEAGAFCGEVLNSEDLISFQVDDLQDAICAMQQAVDHYLGYLNLTSDLHSIVEET